MTEGANAQSHPHVVVLAGPNGAGKTTVSATLLRGALGVDVYVNADVIAQGLSAFAPQGVAIEAGEIMIRRIRSLIHERKNFAFETTLAGRSAARTLSKVVASGYSAHLLFLSLPSADLAIERVRVECRVAAMPCPTKQFGDDISAGCETFLRFIATYLRPGTSMIVRADSSPD